MQIISNRKYINSFWILKWYPCPNYRVLIILLMKLYTLIKRRYSPLQNYQYCAVACNYSALYYYSSLALPYTLQSVATQLLMKPAIPLAKRLVTASHRNSDAGLCMRYDGNMYGYPRVLHKHILCSLYIYIDIYIYIYILIYIYIYKYIDCYSW